MRINAVFTLLIFFSFLFVSESMAMVYDFTDGNKLTLLKKPRDAVALKFHLIRNAKHHIHIMTYYWDDKGFPIAMMKELQKAHARGVDIRIMTTYVPSLTLDFMGKAKGALFSDDQIKKSNATLAYVPLYPVNNEAFTNNVHEKIFLIDGEVAIIGGRNISENDFLDKDMEVMLNGPVVNQVQTHFKKMFDFLIDLKDGCNLLKETNCEKGKFFKWKFNYTDNHFFPEQPLFEDGAKARILTNEVLFLQYKNRYYGKARFDIKDDIIDTIIQTDFKTMRAYNYFVIPTDRYKSYLERNLKEGKDIKIITNSLESASHISDKGYLVGLPDMRDLVSKGLSLNEWLGVTMEEKDNLVYLHEKVMLFDDDHGIIGSHNFGAGSTSVSSEISLEFYSKPIAQSLIKDFNSEFEDSATTKKATLELLDKEISENKFMIRLLHLRPIKTIVKELY